MATRITLMPRKNVGDGVEVDLNLPNGQPLLEHVLAVAAGAEESGEIASLQALIVSQGTIIADLTDRVEALESMLEDYVEFRAGLSAFADALD